MLHSSNPANLSAKQKNLLSNGDTLVNMIDDNNEMWGIIKTNYKKLIEICKDKEIQVISHNYVKLKPNDIPSATAFRIAAFLGQGP